MTWSYPENHPLRAALEREPRGKRPRGRPRKRRTDGMTEDPKSMDVGDWSKFVHDRDEWRDIVVMVKFPSNMARRRRRSVSFDDRANNNS